MSTFKKEQLDQVYGMYLPTFTELTKIASNYGIRLELDCLPNGDIYLISTETYYVENKKNLCIHEIHQGITSTSESTRTYVIDND